MRLSSYDVTPKPLFEARRRFLKLGAASLVASSALSQLLAEESPLPYLTYTPSTTPLNLKPSNPEQVKSYINFYEFSIDKPTAVNFSRLLRPHPWSIEASGEVENPAFYSIEELYRFPLEERIYRFRCVEGWSMVVPWIGFPLAHLLEKLKPTSKGKYVKFTTRFDPSQFPDQQRGRFATIPHPYVEGLRLDEAMHPLTLIALGMYGEPLSNPNGAPVRLIVPWKYGFKSIKSIAKIELVEQPPENTWKLLNPKEYGFYANVNPEVDHPRWSQATERPLGSLRKQKTLLFNGYDEVAPLYAGMDLSREF